MRWVLRAAVRTALGFGVCCGAGRPAKPCYAQVQYRVLDLGTLNGDGTFGRVVNNPGQVAGFSSGANSKDQAFRTAANAAINAGTDVLGTLGGGYCQAYGLNDSAQAVGLSGIFGSTLYHAFRTGPNGKLSITDDLGTLTGSPANYSQAYAININGQVVGVSDTLAGEEAWPAHAFRTAPNQKINAFTDDLGTFGGSYSEARDINAAGEVVGSAYFDGDRVYHGFRTAANAAINPATDDLGTLGGSKSTAIAINDSGVVVGSSLIGGDAIWHAFRVSARRSINPATDSLGTLGGLSSRATDVNASGKVVGFSDTQDASRHAFLFDGTTMHDLNALIDPSAGWVLVEAWSINDNCQITGKGQLSGGAVSHAFLLTPVSGNCQVADLCPADPLKTGPGQCGCGVPDTDSDGDGAADCLDACPRDPTKNNAGQCGCGVPDTDGDADGVADCVDACPGTPKGVVVDQTGCPKTVLSDFDGDGDVDQADLDYLIGCAKGPGIPQDDAGCLKARLDGDTDVDSDDFAIFQRCITNGAPLDVSCRG